MHILIIEDEEQLCRSVAEGLRIDGYETDICFDGDEGLCLCMTENYDLILLDLNLPGTDGLEILRQFREHNTRVFPVPPTVMLPTEMTGISNLRSLYIPQSNNLLRSHTPVP